MTSTPDGASVPCEADEFLRFTGQHRGLLTAEAPDGDRYVLTEHPQVPGKYHVTKGFDPVHTARDPHTHIDVVTGSIAAQRAAEDHAYATFPNWKPSVSHPAAQRLGVRS